MRYNFLTNHYYYNQGGEPPCLVCEVNEEKNCIHLPQGLDKCYYADNETDSKEFLSMPRFPILPTLEQIEDLPRVNKKTKDTWTKLQRIRGKIELLEIEGSLDKIQELYTIKFQTILDKLVSKYKKEYKSYNSKRTSK